MVERILIKPCSACGFHLKDQQHKPGVSANISLNYLLIRGVPEGGRKQWEMEAGGPDGREVCVFGGGG